MAIVTFSWILNLTIFVITAIIGTYMYVTRKFLYWKKRGVMEIPPTPFVGNFADCLLMRTSPGEFVKDLYDRSANLPYMGFYIFDRPFFLARDPELVKSVLLRDFNYFTDRYASAHDSISAAMVFFMNNPGWKLVRSKLTPTFTSGKLKKMFGMMLEVSENLKTYLNSLDLTEGKVFEAKDLCARYTTDIIGATAFGLNVDCLNNPEAEFRKLGRETFLFDFWRSVETTSLFFAPQFVKPMGFKFISKKSKEYLRRTFWGISAERERSGEKRNDLVDRLIDLKNSEVNSRDKNIFEFNGDNLVAQVATYFTAGFETVASSISFALYELALAPNIQSRLREEITDALRNNDNVITYDLIMSLSYLEMVVSETLRKYPSLPFLDRVTNADYKVPNSNLVLEKGTPVYIPVLGLHYDPEYYPDPEVFDPERFTEENNRNRKPYVYLPFGEGPRNCIGMRFGMLETKLAIAYIVSGYELTPCEKTVIPMKLNPKALLMASEKGLYLKIRKIDTAVE